MKSAFARGANQFVSVIICLCGMYKNVGEYK